VTVRLLLAEDDELLREILCDGLAEEGFEVVAARDGADAFARFHADGPFGLLLLDEEMPGMTGRELLGRLRAEGQAVPALLISGNLYLDPEERAALGVGPVLRKPISFADLTGAIRAAIAALGPARV
jgi:two-component system, OmpR family, copper resistance phosphate regulon response regulator CusR